ncbi:DUF6174 domain-containing protein [Rubrivirga sp.]|uniref:DUF6174 domain-containing protein n=1 Tax=Rubrivirga sp. TaxID=1885344 RepID=UPI003B524D5D
MVRLLLAALLIPLAGCPAPATVEAPDEGFPDGPALGGAPAERSPDLDAARARWADAGLDAYAMTLQRICFCPSPDYTGPFAVVVRDGAVESVRLDGAAVDDERGATVADLFDLIDEAYEKGAAAVDVTYDPEMGYPTSVGIDYDARMADEEIAYRVSDLRPADR